MGAMGNWEGVTRGSSGYCTAVFAAVELADEAEHVGEAGEEVG